MSELDPEKPIFTQFQIIHLPSPDNAKGGYEMVYSFVHHAISPFFESCSGSFSKDVEHISGKNSFQSCLGFPVAKKRIAELELSLMNLQQDMEIPDIHLKIHPVIQEALDAAHARKEVLAPSSMGTIVSDAQFLNLLQADVNGWIKEIQKVTGLSRDIDAGSAQQEINFWLNMEKALSKIEEKIASEAITLILDVLKFAKRYHVTVSFLADTGLKEAMDRVQKYNIIMKVKKIQFIFRISPWKIYCLFRTWRKSQLH